MYRLEISGVYRGHFNTAAEAMAVVEQWARPFRDPWVITDGFGAVYARG